MSGIGECVSFFAMVDFHHLASAPGPIVDRLHLRLFEMRLLTINAAWNVANVRSSYWRFYVNNRDGASLILPEGRYPLPGDRVHFVPAWVRFSCHCTGPVEHFYIHFEVVGMPGTLVREVFDRPFTLPECPRLLRDVRAAARRLRSSTSPGLADLMRGKSILAAALADLLDGLPQTAQARCSQQVSEQEALAPVFRHIEANFARPIRNRELAEQARLSEDHFIRRFRAAMGKTPAQYILERRIGAASQRLLFTEDKIDAIAHEVGFANRFHFSRAFTRLMNIPPAAYRRTSRV